MKRYFFIGDVATDTGIMPLFAPLHKGDKALPGHMYSSVIKNLCYARIYDSHGNLYHSMYRGFAIVYPENRKIERYERIEELLTAYPYTVASNLCELVKNIEPLSLSDGSGTLPILVVGKDGWENLSTVPFKKLSSNADFYIVGGSIGIIVLKEQLGTMRPNALKILLKPTTYLVAQRCGVDLTPERKTEKKKRRTRLF